jgi:G3E family GTPase
MTERIPVTVLTGYLGAGKTTLLNRILSEDHGRRYAVIVNEFGEIGIDSDLILNTDEELFEMNNGCICCTVRGDLIRTLHGLLQERGGGSRTFDAIIVETTGLADPGPVVQTFFVDLFLQARTALDSVTTVVDARHILPRLADSREAVEQIAFADQIVLNKTDLVSTVELRDIESRLNALNPLAPIHRAVRAQVALDKVLGRESFDLTRIVALEPGFPGASHGTMGHVHDEHCDHFAAADGHDHEHDSEISSLCLTLDRPVSRVELERWLTQLVARHGTDILRAKGIVDVEGGQRRLVFQSVHMLIEFDLQRPWAADEARHSRLVFIGRNLDRGALRSGLESCARPRQVQ